MSLDSSIVKRFVKNPALHYVSIPGVGPLKEGQVLVGNDYSKYAPRFLVEIPDVPPGAPLESTEPQRGPVPLTEPAPFAPSAPSPRGPELLEEEVQAAPVKRPRGRPRKYPLPG